MAILDNCTNCIYIYIHDSYSLLSAVLDHNIMFYLVV